MALAETTEVRGYQNKKSAALHQEKEIPLLLRNEAQTRQLTRVLLGPNRRHSGIETPDSLDKISKETRHHTFWLPFDALTMEEALALGAIDESHALIATEHSISPEDAYDLWRDKPDLGPRMIGGIAEKLVQSKISVHPLLSEDSYRPDAWTPEVERIARELMPFTFRGTSVFTLKDMETALRMMILTNSGFARLKPAGESGGTGQRVVSFENLDQTIREVKNDPKINLMQDGAVAEPQLEDTYAFSVGQLYMNGKIISYAGVLQQVELKDKTKTILETERYIVEGKMDNLLNKVNFPPRARKIIERAYEYQKKLTEGKGLIILRSSINWLTGLIRNYTHDPEYDEGGLEHTLRIGYSSSGEIGAWGEVGDFPISASVRQAIETNSEIMQTDPVLLEEGDTVALDHKTPQKVIKASLQQSSNIPVTAAVQTVIRRNVQHEVESENRVGEKWFVRKPIVIYQKNHGKR